MLKILYSCLCSAFNVPEDRAWLFQWPLLESFNLHLSLSLCIHPKVVSFIDSSSRILTKFTGTWSTPAQYRHTLQWKSTLNSLASCLAGFQSILSQYYLILGYFLGIENCWFRGMLLLLVNLSSVKTAWYIIDACQQSLRTTNHSNWHRFHIVAIFWNFSHYWDVSDVVLLNH